MKKGKLTEDMREKRKKQAAAPRVSVTEPKIVKQRLTPNYLGVIVVVFLIFSALAIAVSLLMGSTAGWHTGMSGERYYCSSFFRRAQGVEPVDGELMCFDEWGRPASGAVSVRGRTYVANGDGTAANGQIMLDGKLYIVKNGEALCVFAPQGEGLYAPVGAKPDSSGVITAGGESFALTDGLLRRGLVAVDGEKYGYDEHGRLLSGAAEIDGRTLLFDGDGRLLINARRNGWASDESGEAVKIEPLEAGGGGVATQAGAARPSAELNAKLDAILAEIFSSDMNEKQRVRAIYDYVCSALVWGNENTDISDGVAGGLERMALSALGRGDGRSQHYAALTYFLLNRAGFQTIVVKGSCIVPYGEMRESYWCMTAFEGAWYHLDPYCEDYDAEYNCFLAADSELKGVSHDWAEGSLPQSGQSA